MEKVSHYLDTFKDGSVDKAATEMAVKLRDEKLPKSIYKRNCKRFEIDWSGFEGISLETHSSYFTGLSCCCSSGQHWEILEFVTEFYKMMLRLIERGARRVASSELNLLKYELQGHLWILKEASDWFCGKEEEMETIR